MAEIFVKDPDEFVEDQVGETLRLQCPFCGFDYVYSGQVSKVYGYERKCKTPWYSLRGDGIAITIRGECGHKWELVIGNHKGQSFAAVRQVPSESIDEENPHNRDD